MPIKSVHLMTNQELKMLLKSRHVEPHHKSKAAAELLSRSLATRITPSPLTKDK